MWHPVQCNENEKFWYIPLISIGATVIGGAIIILAIRGIIWLLRLLKRRYGNIKKIEEPNIYSTLDIQDWAANFISSNSKFGSFLVFSLPSMENFVN